MDEFVEHAREVARLYRLAAEGTSADSVRVPAEAAHELTVAMAGQGGR